MKAGHKIILNHPLFRLGLPVIYGFMLYLLILLLYNNVGQVLHTFFSQEVITSIVFSALLFETLRAILPRVAKTTNRIKKQWVKNMMFAITGIILSGLIINMLVYLYFSMLIGYRSYTSELVIFNVLFVSSGLLYTSVFMSMVFLEKQKDLSLEKERTLRENLEFELEEFKNKINPSFLFSSLETLISLIYRDDKIADNYLNKLSAVYRKILDQKHVELIAYTTELEGIQNLISLENIQHNGLIALKNNVSPSAVLHVLPNALLRVVEYAAKNTIITSDLPLHISILNDNQDNILISFPKRFKLTITKDMKFLIEELNKTYRFYTNKNIELIEENREISILFPNLIID